MEHELEIVGELTQKMNNVVSNILFLLSKKNIHDLDSINDFIGIIPLVVTNIEMIAKTLKGNDKKDICKGVLSILIQRLVKNEELERDILNLLNKNGDTLIDNFVFMGNFATKVFNKKESCLRKWKAKKSQKKN